MTHEPQHRFTELDGLRGLLALWVVIAHSIRWSGYGEIGMDGFAGKAWHEFTSASAAAETFIILSGFAMTALLQRSDAGYVRFITGRFFRLYPVYLVCMALAVLVTPLLAEYVKAVPWNVEPHVVWMADAVRHAQENWWSHLAWHSVMLHGLPPQAVLEYAASAFHAPAWTITVEWQFYLLVPLLPRLARRYWGIALLVMAAAFGRLIQDAWWNPDQGLVLYWLPMLFVGIGSYYLVSKVPVWHEMISKNHITSGLIGIGSILFLKSHVLPLVIWIVAFCITTKAWEACLPRVSRMASAALNSRPAQWLGQISYSLYLLHWPLLIAVVCVSLKVWPDITRQKMLLVVSCAAFPMILLLSHLLHMLLEKPMMRLGRRLSGRS